MQTLRVRPLFYVYKVRCDRCGAEACHEVDIGFNNFLSVEFHTSWGSELGDENRVAVDICHGCLKETLGPWLTISQASKSS